LWCESCAICGCSCRIQFPNEGVEPAVDQNIDNLGKLSNKNYINYLNSFLGFITNAAIALFVCNINAISGQKHYWYRNAGNDNFVCAMLY
jgi:hypothetical protein